MNYQFTSAVRWRIASMISGIASSVLLLKLLSFYIEDPGPFGVVNGALTVLLLLPFLDFGFRTAINQRLLVETSPDQRLRLTHFGQQLYRRIAGLLFPLVVGAMALYSQIPSAKEARKPISFFLFLGAAGTLSTLVFAQTNLLVGWGEQRRLFQINTWTSWLNLGVVWVGLAQHFELWSIPAGMFATATVQGGLAWFFCRQAAPGVMFFGGVSREDFRRLFKELNPAAIACFRGQLSIVLLYTIDSFLVSSLGQPHAAAVAGARYSIASRLFAQARNLLQAGSEAMWPIIAQFRGQQDQSPGRTRLAHLSEWLLRLNAWLYGGALGAMTAVVAPFAAWWTRNHTNSWAPGQTLVTLMAARFLIGGISSPTAFYLLGAGKFSVLARYCERELLVGVLLSIPLGLRYHGEGVAIAFLVASSFGTFTPLFWNWARDAGLEPLPLYIAIAGRASVAAATSGLVTWGLRDIFGSEWQVVSAASLGGLATVLVACLWTLRRPAPHLESFLGKYPRLANL